MLYYKPTALWIFHSDDDAESLRPAKKLKKFFANNYLLQPENIKLFELPFDDANAIWNKLNELNAIGNDFFVNITGGNKLMSLMVSRWSELKKLPFFYLEKNLKIIEFNFSDKGLKTKNIKLKNDIADLISPIDAIKCQVSTVEVERPGETLKFNTSAQTANKDKITELCNNGDDPRKWLEITNPLPESEKEGDRLEYLTALILLKLGIKKVFRSVELKVKNEAKSSIHEIDLVFIYHGKLWIVDCKDKKSEDWVYEGLKKILEINQPVLWERIESLLNQKTFKELRNDYLVANEIGGLKTGIICVRKTTLNDKEKKLAMDCGIHQALKENLEQDLRNILEGKVSENELDTLSKHFNRS